MALDKNLFFSCDLHDHFRSFIRLPRDCPSLLLKGRNVFLLIPVYFLLTLDVKRDNEHARPNLRKHVVIRATWMGALNYHTHLPLNPTN